MTEEEKTIPVPRWNLGDYVREAALVGGIVAGVGAAAVYTEPPKPPVRVQHPKVNHVTAIMADRAVGEIER